MKKLATALCLLSFVVPLGAAEKDGRRRRSKREKTETTLAAKENQKFEAVLARTKVRLASATARSEYCRPNTGDEWDEVRNLAKRSLMENNKRLKCLAERGIRNYKQEIHPLWEFIAYSKGSSEEQLEMLAQNVHSLATTKKISMDDVEIVYGAVGKKSGQIELRDSFFKYGVDPFIKHLVLELKGEQEKTNIFDVVCSPS